MNGFTRRRFNREEFKIRGKILKRDSRLLNPIEITSKWERR
jgi:hypothetical protein